MMRKKLTIAALGAGLLASTLGVQAANAENPEVVIEWNQILQDTIPGTAGLQSPRYYAMMHIAMFDAVNAIERDYSPYRVLVKAHVALRRKRRLPKPLTMSCRRSF